MCLVGRFLTDKSINFNVMKHQMASIWHPGKGVCIKDISDQRFLFQFFHSVDLKRDLEGGAWTYDNHVLFLHHLKPGEIPNQIPLFHVDYWVQVYDLPVGFMSFVEYDDNNNSGLWRNFMRIKVRLDVRNPLKRWKKIKKMGGEWLLVKFKYERLSHFCFICGLLGHIDRFCDKLFSTNGEEVKKEWGQWLRAPDR
uniref:CCHC-type domain-containing protein n=1 Tax=Nelumbo nucifera TaxID=4432 RepID=A0A822Z317_NELNU|nr:TPA_asm: hypothetical protein HUJ06_013225 [Nelumbo nucifera]